MKHLLLTILLTTLPLGALAQQEEEQGWWAKAKGVITSAKDSASEAISIDETIPNYVPEIPSSTMAMEDKNSTSVNDVAEDSSHPKEDSVWDRINALEEALAVRETELSFTKKSLGEWMAKSSSLTEENIRVINCIQPE